MCKAYTQGFVKMGLLEAENRVGFSTASAAVRCQIDQNRGRHEIPLHDPENGTTRYGLEALTYLLGRRWPGLQPVFRSRVFYGCFYPLYQLITYNRRIMAGSGGPVDGFDCGPDFHRLYRSLYLVLVLTGISLMTGKLILLGAGLVLAGLSLVGGVVLLARAPRKGIAAWDYWGNMASSVLLGALTMLPSLWFNGETGFLLINGLFALWLTVREMRRRR